MAISSDYSSPVWVNGFSCRNCSDVALAQKNVDPANPSSGPFGINDPKNAAKNVFSAEARQQDRLAELHQSRSATQGSPVNAAYGAVDSITPGRLIDITA